MGSEVFVFESGDLFIKTEFVSDDIKLLILSGSCRFKGTITKSQLDQVERKLAGKIEHVAEMARKTFSESCDQHFSLAVESEGDDEKPVLVWRKLGAGGGKIKLRLATFVLDPVETGEMAYKDFIRLLIKDRSSLKKTLEETKSKLTTKSEDLERALQLSEDLSKEQLNREEELIKQFLPILNNKKRRIQELEDQLSGVDQGHRLDDSYDAETDDEQNNTDVDDPDTTDNHNMTDDNDGHNMTEDNYGHNMTDDNDGLDMTDNASGSKRKLQDSNGKGEPLKHPKVDTSDEDDLFDNL